MTAARLPRGRMAMLGRRPSGRIVLVDGNHELGCALAECVSAAVAVSSPGELPLMAKRLRGAWPCLDLLLVCRPGQDRQVVQRAAEAVGGVVLEVGTESALDAAKEVARTIADAVLEESTA